MAAGQQQQSQEDAGYTPLWIAGGLFIAGFLFWYLLHDQIVGIMIHLKIYQLSVLSFFEPSLKVMQADLSQYTPATYPGVTFDAFQNILDIVGQTLRYPVMGILGVLAIWLYFSSPILKYKRTLSLQALTEQEATDWPQITPVVKLDLVKESIDMGPWAMGIVPMKFAKQHRLLKEEGEVFDTSAFSKGQMTVSLLRGLAYQVFATQLGAYWMGFERLPAHTQALFAIFAARIAGDRDGASKLVAQVAASAKFDPKNKKKPELNYAGTIELFRKHQGNKLVVKVTQQHAFVMTVMASMLMTARNDCVLAAADFLWLKPVDRTLWFMLNSVGRRTTFVEVAGPYAHWIAERQLGQPIKLPMIEEAINGLDMAVKEIIYVRDEKQEESA